MTRLFSDQEWIGEFFVPDQYDKRFSGEITYSPENGVVLNYSITGLEVPNETEVLFGVLNNGAKCTLIGKFSPQSSSFNLKHGLYTRQGRSFFKCLLIGDYVKHDEMYSDIEFTLTNLQEFFFPKSFKDREEYRNKPLFSLNTLFGEIKVGNSAAFIPLSENISSQIYSLNKSALGELTNLFSEIQRRHPDSFFMLKKDISYRIYLNFNSGTSIFKAYEVITDIANLFAILIYNPVYPETITVNKKTDKGLSHYLDVIPSIALEKKTIGICTNERSHFDMPITNSNVDLSSIMDIWIKSSEDYSTVVSSIQHETGFRDKHSVHGEIVLYTTQLESISYYQDVKNKNRYEYPIETYGSPEIKEGLMKIFEKVGENELGKGVGTLRDEIVHVGKPKKALRILSLKDLVYISKYLHLTILGLILTNLSVNKEIIRDYQAKFMPGS
jgi:hypothetical protein